MVQFLMQSSPIFSVINQGSYIFPKSDKQNGKMKNVASEDRLLRYKFSSPCDFVQSTLLCAFIPKSVKMRLIKQHGTSLVRPGISAPWGFHIFYSTSSAWHIVLVLLNPRSHFSLCLLIGVKFPDLIFRGEEIKS